MKLSVELSDTGNARGDVIPSSDVSSTSNAESSLDLSASEKGGDGGDGNQGCLKNTKCLKGVQHWLKDRDCLKDWPSLKGQASALSDSFDTGIDYDTCLNSQPCKKDTRKVRSAGTRAPATPGGTECDSHSGETSAFDGASFKGEGEAWTLSEDCAIRGMKESGDGLSWTEIAESLGRTRSDVKSRWKWIQAYLASAEEKRKSQDSGPRKSEDRKGGKATDIIDKGKGNASPSIPLPKKENNGVQAPPVQKGGCSKSKRDKTGHSAACLDTLSGEEASSELSVSDDAAFDLEDEARRQDRYLQETLRGELYGPAHASIQPDELFGPRDSQILAAAESKYHRSKWLEMQANFYNATGRMVPLELIRAKCERAERERYLDSQPAMNGGHKVRQWMSQLEREEAARR